MVKEEIHLTELWPETLHALEHEGALLVTAGRGGKPNAMTIGWGAIGRIWGRSIFLVLVRPSRYTYALIEDADDFTVNVLPRGREENAKLCGTRSGREMDKLAACGLTPVAARVVRSPILEECIIHYECRIVMKNDVISDALAPEVRKTCYPRGDFHRIYYGEVVAAYADANARERATGPDRTQDAPDQSEY
ncbi:MAG TPA: flavin reductase family protein [Armatimonadota bacterium]|nr:flavin reductase family protein [Armatimonadota bacterium]HPO72411.1 flavin reductase family protein [Armatimonadota bacterium]